MKSPSKLRMLLVLAALPALVPLLLILKFGVDFPFWDEWHPNLAGLYIRFHQHQLTFADLWAQHNEHRILVPRMVLLALNFITHFNTIDEMLLEWVILCITSLGVLVLIRRTIRSHTALLWFLCNLMIFTPAQHENLLWGIGVINVMPMALLVWMLVALGSRMRMSAKTTVAILLAAAATYSLGNGLLAWPIGLFVMRANWKQRTAWLVAAVVFIGLYFVGYIRPEHETQAYAHSILGLVQYFLVFLGAPFAAIEPAHADWVSLAFGAVMLATLLITAGSVARRGSDGASPSPARAWVAVGAFAVFSAAMASGTRAGFGPWQAIQSTRYVSFALYLPVALIVLLATMVNRRVAILLLTVLVVTELLCYPGAMHACQAQYQKRLEIKAALLLIDVLPDNPMIERELYTEPQIAKREAHDLNQMGWLRPALVQTNDAAAIAAPQHGDVVQGAIDSATAFGAVGWAARIDEHRPADAVVVTYDDANGRPIIFAMAQMGLRREDVAQLTGDSELADSGWVAVFAHGKLPQQMRSITLRAWALDVKSGKTVPLSGAIVVIHE